MKKINYILTLLLLAVGVNWAKADDQTLALGNYDDLTAYDCVENQTYQGSWWMVAPTQLQVKHTGAQIICTKEQLASMKGKHQLQVLQPCRFPGIPKDNQRMGEGNRRQCLRI